MPSAALDELDALRRETEAAVTHIVWAAETILAACRPGDPAGLEVARAQALAVIEACGFQDLTGQRLAKIADMLRSAEAELAGRGGSGGGGEGTGEGGGGS